MCGSHDVQRVRVTGLQRPLLAEGDHDTRGVEHFIY